MTRTHLKILAPVDIAHIHPGLCECLKAILPLTEASVTLLYVREEMPAYENMLGTMAEFPTDLGNQIEIRAKEVLAEQSELLRICCKEVLSEVVLGPASLMIETVAKENDVQLIVMTPGHHSKVAQFLIGSTCERVAKHAEMSVLIMRAEQPTSLRNIVFGIDGSKAALTAMLEAVETFGLVERNVKAILVNVVSVTPIVTYVSPPGFVARVEDNLIMSGEASLAEAEKMICDAGVKNVSVKLKNGSPESELLKVVEEMQAEMIVLGSQKRSTLEQVFIGSVASKVVAHAPCSVAVFKNLAALPV